MSIEDDIRVVAGRIPSLKERLTTEEATKQALILPFLQALGYNVFDPTEVMPEYTADIGTKQGEKVDYAIMSDDAPVMLIECKRASDKLASPDRVSQLYRYFSTDAKIHIGVLTNGILYQFFSDLDSPNVMDTTPFLEVNLEDLNPGALEQVGQFAKGFDLDETVETASRLRYINGMKGVLTKQFNHPEEDFVEWLGRRVYSGRMTQTVKEKFTALTRRAFHEFVNDRITTTLRAAQDLTQIQQEEIPPQREERGDETHEQDQPKIVTTAQELQGYEIVKDIAQDIIEPERVTLRDSQSYCGIFLDDTNRRPLCRFYFDRKQKYIGLFDGSRNNQGSLVEKRFPVDSLNDIYNHADQIRETVLRYMDS